ncbi:MAG TPA: peptidylprolyl isomerase [Sporichthyaceae bacterium]|nr:peptidylprolyl isomerase [Sporichthyaceae bacterium]
MAGKGKQTSAERRKERQAAARVAAVKRRRKVRLQLTGAVLAVGLAGGGVAGGVVFFRHGSSSSTAAKPPPDLSLSPAPTPNQSGAPAGMVNCVYVPQPPPPSHSPSEIDPKHPTFPPTTAENTTPAYATLDTTEGQIVMELDAKLAPCSVNSFVSLAKQGFYDNTPCHRLVDESQAGATYGILQCGDPTGTGRGNPGYKFADEALDGAKYPRGEVAMANSGPNTNGSQFFMMFKDSDFEASYSPFGHILAGMDVLEKVAAGGTTTNPLSQQNDAPKTKITITKVTISPTRPPGVPTALPSSTPTPTTKTKAASTPSNTPTPTPTPTSTP